MRPFFLLCAAAALLLPPAWVALLALGLPAPPVVGGALVWHAHELIFGFGFAAVAGFVLTAVPEFTHSAGIAPRRLRGLLLCWLLGRLGFALSGLPGGLGLAMLALAGSAHLALLLGLAAQVAPALLADPGRRHLSLLWALLGLALLTLGFYVDGWRGLAPVRWLYATLGLLMILIVLAMSRISMSLVNRAIEQANAARPAGTAPQPAYLARPPRRHLALLCIALYSLAEFFAPASRPGGWLALAASAALFNLQTDWHIGRPLLRRWPALLLGVYVLMALGYGLMGLALLGGFTEALAFSAGRHLLSVGALGLNVYLVICIAGRAHCGQALDERPWVLLGALLILAACLARLLAAWAGGTAWLAVAGGCWAGAYALLLCKLGPLLWRARADGGSGC